MKNPIFKNLFTYTNAFVICFLKKKKIITTETYFLRVDEFSTEFKINPGNITILFQLLLLGRHDTATSGNFKQQLKKCDNVGICNVEKTLI